MGGSVLSGSQGSIYHPSGSGGLLFMFGLLQWNCGKSHWRRRTRHCWSPQSLQCSQGYKTLSPGSPWPQRSPPAITFFPTRFQCSWHQTHIKTLAHIILYSWVKNVGNEVWRKRAGYITLVTRVECEEEGWVEELEELGAQGIRGIIKPRLSDLHQSL